MWSNFCTKVCSNCRESTIRRNHLAALPAHRPFWACKLNMLDGWFTSTKFKTLFTKKSHKSTLLAVLISQLKVETHVYYKACAVKPCKCCGATADPVRKSQFEVRRFWTLKMTAKGWVNHIISFRLLFLLKSALSLKVSGGKVTKMSNISDMDWSQYIKHYYAKNHSKGPKKIQKLLWTHRPSKPTIGFHGMLTPMWGFVCLLLRRHVKYAADNGLDSLNWLLWINEINELLITLIISLRDFTAKYYRTSLRFYDCHVI